MYYRIFYNKHTLYSTLVDILQENEYTCLICNYKCYTLQDLQIHIHIHAGDKPFKCSICPFKTSCKLYLKLHAKSAHLDVGPFVCKICLQEFLSEAQMNTHMAEHSITPEIFQCRNCTFTGKTQYRLNKHYKMFHNSQPPHRCDKCNYETVFKSNITKHMYVHDDRKLFVCLGCHKSYKWFSSLKTHVKKCHST